MSKGQLDGQLDGQQDGQIKELGKVLCQDCRQRLGWEKDELGVGIYLSQVSRLYL